MSTTSEISLGFVNISRVTLVVTGGVRTLDSLASYALAFKYFVVFYLLLPRPPQKSKYFLDQITVYTNVSHNMPE